MPRIGQNPMKWLGETNQPKQITITTIVHLPTLEGYWQHGLEVLQTCIQSLHQNTGHPFDLMLLDNGSCEVVRAYLFQAQKEGLIQYLIFSRDNLRKLGALDFLLHVAPGDIISFTDSDVFFLPGWLDETLKILESFPEAGQITALPTADRGSHYCSSTLKGVAHDKTLTVQRGELISKEYIQAHAVSLGETWDSYQKRLIGREDVLITRNGIQALVSAQDFQFTTTRRVVQSVLPLRLENPEHYYDPLYSPVFEAKLDEVGYWRLATTNYLVHHMGNHIPNLQKELPWLSELPMENSKGMERFATIQERKKITKERRVFQNRHIRRALKWINTLSYRLLYE